MCAKQILISHQTTLLNETKVQNQVENETFSCQNWGKQNGEIKIVQLRNTLDAAEG